MKKTIKKIVVQTLIFFVFLEIGLILLYNLGFLNIGRPSYNFKAEEKFYIIDSTFGVWRKTDHSFFHITGCFQTNYQSNSIGARDKERELNSAQSRVMVIGDSFTAGWGVKNESRFSNILEQKNNMEFINMGIGNIGPTQEYLLYKNKAKKYNHTSVLWALFPENDVIDDDPSYWSSIHKDGYRGFWKGKYPNYSLVYGPGVSNERATKKTNPIKTILKNFFYSYHLQKYIRYKYIERNAFTRASYLGKSGYFNISDKQWNRIKYSIEKLMAESNGKPLNMFTIPSKYDIKKYQEYKVSIPLRDSLEKLSSELGFSYYDLLEEFDKTHTPVASELYFNCDGHWDKNGHQWAARILDSVFTFNHVKYQKK